METGNPTLAFAVGMDRHRERVARAAANERRRETAPAEAGWRRSWSRWPRASLRQARARPLGPARY